MIGSSNARSGRSRECLCLVSTIPFPFSEIHDFRICPQLFQQTEHTTAAGLLGDRAVWIFQVAECNRSRWTDLGASRHVVALRQCPISGPRVFSRLEQP